MLTQEKKTSALAANNNELYFGNLILNPMDYKNILKKVQALKNKKFRKEYREFIIEGEKIILESLESDFRISSIWLISEGNDKISQKAAEKGIQINFVNKSWIERASSLKSNNTGIAILKLPEAKLPDFELQTWTLVLDGINDPGNFGTIIRTAEWYGVKEIICSMDCVELYNPKVLMASKGSFLRVGIRYEDLSEFFKKHNATVLAADMSGEDLHELKEIESKGFLLMGSESHGISKELETHISKRIHIKGAGQAESLNVGIATAIILDNLKRMLNT